MLEDDELFCHECGTKQEIEESEAQAEETVATEGKYCIHCGEAVEADSMFCPFCGKPQEVEEEKNNKPQPNTAEPESQQELGMPKAEEQPTYEWEEEKKSKTWLWILLALLIAGGAGWYFLSSESDSDSSPAVESNYVEEPVEESVDSAPEEYEKEEVYPTSPLAFLEDFYKGNLDDVDYIKQHVTANVINKLKRDYKNECPSGDCLATWVFTAYPPGSDLYLEEGPIITKSKE